jgi:hypothetical protein
MRLAPQRAATVSIFHEDDNNWRVLCYTTDREMHLVDDGALVRVHQVVSLSER